MLRVKVAPSAGPVPLPKGGNITGAGAIAAGGASSISDRLPTFQLDGNNPQLIDPL